MSKEKAMPITALGLEFKKTKSEKLFKLIYDRLKHGVIQYYSNFGKDHQLVEDAYNEAMISIWRDIDKLDVKNYSISTNVYMKTRQHIIKDNIRTTRSCGNAGGIFVDSPDIVDNLLANNLNSGNSIILGKHAKYQEHMNTLVGKSEEELFIKEEEITNFLNFIDKCNFSDIIKDHYIEGLKYKELSEKYDIEIQIVKNRIHHGKKQIKKKILNTNYEKVSKIFD
jgi:RNA polymerase sigma factor (sigma-70 family)